MFAFINLHNFMDQIIFGMDNKSIVPRWAGVTLVWPEFSVIIGYKFKEADFIKNIKWWRLRKYVQQALNSPWKNRRRKVPVCTKFTVLVFNIILFVFGPVFLHITIIQCYSMCQVLFYITECLKRAATIEKRIGDNWYGCDGTNECLSESNWSSLPVSDIAGAIGGV